MKTVSSMGIILILCFSLIFASNMSENNHNLKTNNLNSFAPVGKSGGAVKPNLNFGNFPLSFIINKGQVNSNAAFYARASKYTLWLTKEGLIFDRPNDVSRFLFVNADKNPAIIPVKKTRHRVNYFIGKNRAKWFSDIPTSQAVLYKNLYKKIDLKVYGIEKQIEYDWIVKTGGDPGDIRFEYKNAKRTRIDEKGNVQIETKFGKLTHKKPVSYQAINRDKRTEVNVKFKKTGKNTFGFEVGAYDKTHELIIDPVVSAYSTYLGGSNVEEGLSIAVGAGGSVYVTGYTDSVDFPTLNQYQTDGDINDSASDVFVTRIDTTGVGAGSLIYSTYLGGDDDEDGNGIAVDAAGNAYVTGYTISTDFPTLNQYQTNADIGDSVSDVFVTKLSPAGNSILYSTYLGGDSIEHGLGIALDNSANVYVTGYTESTDFPTLNQYQDYGDINDSASNVFVTRLDTTGVGAGSLIYSTYLGGDDDEDGNGIAVAGSGNVYVTGFTYSTDFPTLNPYQTDGDINDSASDVFVTRLDTTGVGAGSLIYSTYLGGENEDAGWAIAVDAGGNVYVTGATMSAAFPTVNSYKSSLGGFFDAFVTKLSSTGDSLLYSTYLGGSQGGFFPWLSYDEGVGIAVNAAGNAYVTGLTNSTDFPVLDAFQSSFQGGAMDGFVTKLSVAGDSLVYSTYLGGSAEDGGIGIALDAGGSTYVTGYTESANFPTLNAYEPVFQGGGVDAFVTKLGELPAVTTLPVSSITISTASSGGNVISTGGSPVTARGVCWSTSPNPTVSDGITTDGSGTGTFTSSITGLVSASTYYVRAYAVNSGGTGYGNEETFSTDVTVSGTVTNGVNPIRNVIITFSHDNHTETTDAGGNYSYVVPYGTTTTIIPDFPTVTSWNPAWIYLENISADMSNQDFQAAVNNSRIISGIITSGGDGLANVTLARLPGNPRTNASGYYSAAVNFGWSGTVTPSLAGYIFTPRSISYSNVTSNQMNQNYTAVSTDNPVISGVVWTVDGSRLPGVTFSFSNNGGTAVSDQDGNYSQMVSSGWSGAVIPSKEGYEFIPADRVYTGITTSQGNNDFISKIITVESPEIQINRDRLNFGADMSSNVTAGQFILVSNSGAGTLNWTASTDQNWLKCGPASGKDSGIVSVSVNVSNLAAGTYTGNVTISDANAANSPRTVNVTLNVYTSTQAPFGVFSTPIDGSTVYSSIPVTGWALDDVEVKGVKIYREAGNDLVYIGDAVFVEGARPDVEFAYPGYPMNYRAGWGYMLLTNFLPDNGNGTFTLHAIAADLEGNEVQLGKKTITVDNANAVKPFGSIDKPGQGEIVSGDGYVNWGWVLTPKPNTVPTDGSTIDVYIDGVKLGNPGYNIFRNDITSLFPGYNNSNGAVGKFYLDTTNYTNGVHTIQWKAADDAGNTDGIGSRYFSIQNTGTTSRRSGVNSQWSGRPLDILSKLPDAGGKTEIDAKELEHLEVRIGHSFSRISGHMIVGNKPGPLPIGSTLKNGIFYWSPGPGFTGRYRFLFVVEGKNGAICKKELTVTIKPVFPGIYTDV